MGSKMIKTRTDLNVHTAPEGWFPTNLTRAEKREYVEYHKNRDWAATNRWADGSPRNPMPEIRLQNKMDKPGGNWRRKKKKTNPSVNKVTLGVE